MGIIEKIGLYESKQEDVQFKIFLDQDGTITNWQKAWLDLGVSKLEGEEYEKKYGRDALWSEIAEKGKLEFWSEMEWLPEGRKLWNYVKKFNPTILSSPTRNKCCVEGKKIWIERELGKDVPYIFEKDKYNYADINSILIDDTEKKIKDWIELGDGVGILHTSTDNTINELKKYGL